MNNISVYAKNTGMIILGGGLMKHHICNANLMVSYFQHPALMLCQSLTVYRFNLLFHLNFLLSSAFPVLIWLQ